MFHVQDESVELQMMTPRYVDQDSYKLLATKTILNPGTEDALECIGYRRDLFKSILSHIISVLLLGFPYLLGHWKPEWKLKAHRSKSPLFLADTVLVQERAQADHDKSAPSVCKIIVENVADNFIQQYIHKSDLLPSDADFMSSSSSSSSDRDRLWMPSKYTFRYFIHQHCKYVWDAKKKTYTRLHGLDNETTPLHLFSTVLSQGTYLFTFSTSAVAGLLANVT